MPLTQEKRDKIVNAMRRYSEEKHWKPVLECLGINDEEAERLVRLLLMHLILDRGITGLLAMKLADASASSSLTKIEAGVATISMDKRIDLAKSLNVISDSCAADIKEVNKVRNKFAHYKPSSGWDLKVEEISTAAAFEKCARRGRCAVTSLANVVARFHKALPLLKDKVLLKHKL
jgi:hypothetical protein